MKLRYLPALTFILVAAVGFGLDQDAEGQPVTPKVTTVQWTPPDYPLPWGMTWPPEQEVPVASPATSNTVGGPSGLQVSANASASDTATQINSLQAVPSEIEMRLTQLEAIEARIQRLHDESMAARRFAEQACGGPVLVGAEGTDVVIATPSPEQVEASAALLVDVLKKMKPALAAQMMAEWDDLLTIGLLRRLGSRRAAPILSKMPVDMSGRLTRRIAAGEGAMPQGEAK